MIKRENKITSLQGKSKFFERHHNSLLVQGSCGNICLQTLNIYLPTKNNIHDCKEPVKGYPYDYR